MKYYFTPKLFHSKDFLYKITEVGNTSINCVTIYVYTIYNLYIYIICTCMYYLVLLF